MVELWTARALIYVGTIFSAVVLISIIRTSIKRAEILTWIILIILVAALGLTFAAEDKMKTKELPTQSSEEQVIGPGNYIPRTHLFIHSSFKYLVRYNIKI